MSMLSRRLLMWGGAAAVASAGFAFMATNSVPTTYAGQGQGTISGYAVSNVHYSDATGDPASPSGWAINGVTFDLAPAGAPAINVHAYIQAGSQWFDYSSCTVTGAGSGYTQYSCSRGSGSNPEAPEGPANTLEVTAAQ